jgi:hypothetical protein
MSTATTTLARRATSPATARSRAMTTEECRSWLTSHVEGRLGYLSGRGPRHVVIAYALDGQAILMRIPDYNEMAHYVPGRWVTLDVTGFTADDAIEQVRVTGHASVCDDTDAGNLSRLPDQGWPDDLSTVLVSVPLQMMSGQVVRTQRQVEATA